MLELVKPLHVVLALASGAGFVVRGIWTVRGSALLRAKPVRVAPHVVDTLLLASGLAMAFGQGISPLEQPWFAAKLAAVVLYIAAGAIALRPGADRRVRIGAFAAAVALYAYVVATALRHDPSPWA